MAKVLAVGIDRATIVEFEWEGDTYLASGQKVTILKEGVVIPTSPRLPRSQKVTVETEDEGEVVIHQAIHAPDVAEVYLDAMGADDPTELDLYDPNLGRGPDGEVLSR